MTKLEKAIGKALKEGGWVLPKLQKHLATNLKKELLGVVEIDEVAIVKKLWWRRNENNFLRWTAEDRRELAHAIKTTKDIIKVKEG